MIAFTAFLLACLLVWWVLTRRPRQRDVVTLFKQPGPPVSLPDHRFMTDREFSILHAGTRRKNRYYHPKTP